LTPNARASLRDLCRDLKPVRPDYMNLPIEEGFDWSSCLGGVPFGSLYLVVFRSVRRADADPELLKRYDDLAYAEAWERGGLVHYFKGELNERRECLSFCLWESRGQAVAAASGARHEVAASITAQMYDSYVLERYEVVEGDRGPVFRRLGGTQDRAAERRLGVSA
jgi:hypothetical protein